MLIDEFLPEYQIAIQTELAIDAPVHVVYRTVTSVDMGRSAIIKTLFKLRGLPQSMLTLEGIQKAGFTKLGENPNQELLFGLAGRFWSLKRDLLPIDATSFKKFRKTGFAKAVWNFTVVQIGENRTQIKTETRVQCTDRKSYAKFRLYWIFVGPFSSLIRKRMLSIIRKESEATAKHLN